MRLTKNKKILLDKIGDCKIYKIEEAIRKIKELSFAKFNESLDIAVNLDIDTKKSDQAIRGVAVLPHGNGKVKRILAICDSVDEKKCIEAGADFAGNDDYLEKIEKEGWFGFDTIVTTPKMMMKFGKLGKLLGPKGLMPNPKTGGITTDLARSIKEIKSGRIEFKSNKNGVVHGCIGKISFKDGDLVDNFDSFISSLLKLRPASVKGNFVRSIGISSTMGPGFFVKF